MWKFSGRRGNSANNKKNEKKKLGEGKNEMKNKYVFKRKEKKYRGEGKDKHNQMMS